MIKIFHIKMFQKIKMTFDSLDAIFSSWELSLFGKLVENYTHFHTFHPQKFQIFLTSKIGKYKIPQNHCTATLIFVVWLHYFSRYFSRFFSWFSWSFVSFQTAAVKKDSLAEFYSPSQPAKSAEFLTVAVLGQPAEKDQ